MVIVYRYIQITREGNHSIHAAKMFKSMKDIILKEAKKFTKNEKVKKIILKKWEKHFFSR